MKFFYMYINDLKEPDTVSEEIDPATLGTLLHEVMKTLCERFIGRQVGTDLLINVSNNKALISGLIDTVINKRFRKGDNSVHIANELIIKNVLMVYVMRVLDIDKKYAPFSLLSVEKKIVFKKEIITKGRTTGIDIGGIIDRIDTCKAVVRIVDYKTGKTADHIQSVSDLFIEDRKKDYDSWLQTLLYCEGYIRQNPGTSVVPAVYKIRKIPGTGMSELLSINAGKKESFELSDYAVVREEFNKGLENVVDAIFNESEPFIMTNDIRNKCSICPYRVLCMR